MATKTTNTLGTTNQVTTNDLPETASIPDRLDQPDDALYPPSGPDPSGTRPEAVAAMEQENPDNAPNGFGVQGEDVIWEGRYAMKNFAGRLVFRTVLSLAWIALAVYTWGSSDGSIAPLTIGLGVVLIVLWVLILYRIAQARFGHFYRLTNRRLFVSTGLFQRRRDQMELLRVKDVFTRQTWTERMLSLGTVVVVSSEKELPTFYLSGVNDPKRVMDLVWHEARTERDNRSVKVDRV